MAISAQYPCKLKLIVFIGCILFPTPQEAFLTSPSLAYTAQKRLIPTDFDVKEPCPNKEWITEKWFPQKLDHFNSSDSRTYGQRYFTNWKFNKRISPQNATRDPPIFLIIGGEWEMKWAWICTDNMTFMRSADENNAIAVMLEHRFFGKNKNMPDLSVDNLAYLTVGQALADVVSFIEGFSKVENLTNSKWVAFGGSYPGALCAWLRLKRPDLTLGNVCSSPAMSPRVNYWEYAEVVENDIKETSDDCYQNIKLAFKEIRNATLFEEGRAQLSSIFRIDPPLQADPDDFRMFFNAVFLGFDCAAQNWPHAEVGGTPKLSQACEMMNDDTIGSRMERAARVVQFVPCHIYLYDESKKTMDVNYQRNVAYMQNVSLDFGEAASEYEQSPFKTDDVANVLPDSSLLFPDAYTMYGQSQKHYYDAAAPKSEISPTPVPIVPVVHPISVSAKSERINHSFHDNSFDDDDPNFVAAHFKSSDFFEDENDEQYNSDAENEGYQKISLKTFFNVQNNMAAIVPNKALKGKVSEQLHSCYRVNVSGEALAVLASMKSFSSRLSITNLVGMYRGHLSKSFMAIAESKNYTKLPIFGRGQALSENNSKRLFGTLARNGLLWEEQQKNEKRPGNWCRFLRITDKGKKYVNGPERYHIFVIMELDVSKIRRKRKSDKHRNQPVNTTKTESTLPNNKTAGGDESKDLNTESFYSEEPETKRLPTSAYLSLFPTDIPENSGGALRAEDFIRSRDYVENQK